MSRGQSFQILTWVLSPAGNSLSVSFSRVFPLKLSLPPSETASSRLSCYSLACVTMTCYWLVWYILVHSHTQHYTEDKGFFTAKLLEPKTMPDYRWTGKLFSDRALGDMWTLWTENTPLLATERYHLSLLPNPRPGSYLWGPNLHSALSSTPHPKSVEF